MIECLCKNTIVKHAICLNKQCIIKYVCIFEISNIEIQFWQKVLKEGGKMKVFIGSSREQEDRAQDVANWLERLGVDSIIWDEVGAFIPGQYTLDDLVRLSNEVDAAVFVFAADDKTWYRKDVVKTVRDNVLFEYGLFCGKLSKEKVIFITIGSPSLATDLNGVTFINLGDRTRDAKERLKSWIQFINPSGEKINTIEIRRRDLAVFDERGFADQIFTLTEIKDGWIEVKVDYSSDYSAQSAFCGLLVSKRHIDISHAGTMVVEIEFTDEGLGTIDLELKNHTDNLFEKVSLSRDAISNNMCTVDLSALQSDLLRNIDEVVLCTRPNHFINKNNKCGKYKIRSLSVF